MVCEEVGLVAASRVLRVGSEWDRLTVVAVVRPECFVLAEPINSTQRRFYGTEDQPSASLLVNQHASVFRVLTAAGVQVVDVKPTSDLPFQFNVRDAAVVIGSRLALGRMARAVRRSEPAVLGAALGAESVVTVAAGQMEGSDITRNARRGVRWAWRANG